MVEKRIALTNALLFLVKHSSVEATETSSAVPRTSFSWPWKFFISNPVLSSLVGLVTLALGLYRIQAPSLWFDEILSVERASQSLPTLWHIVNASQPNMALYYFILHFWLKFATLLGFPPTEAVVRFPSAIFAASAAIMLFLLVRNLFGVLVGLSSAALYIFNRMQLVYTQDTRSYALVLFLLLLGWYSLLTALTTDKHRYRWLVCYMIAMALSVYAHYISLLLIMSQGIALAALLVFPTSWRTRVRSMFRSLLLSLLGTSILIIPMLLASRVGAQTDWIPTPHPKDILNLFRMFSNSDNNYLHSIEILAAFGLFVGLLASFTRGVRLLRCFHILKGYDDKQLMHYQLILPFSIVLLCWLVVPIIVSYILTHVSIHLFLARYLVTALPAFCLLAILGIIAIRWRWIRLTVTLCLVFFTMMFVPHYYASAQAEDWRSGSLWVEQHYQQNDGLVCFNNLHGCQVGLEYYFQAYPSSAHFDIDSPGSFSYVQYDLYRPDYEPDVEQATNIGALQRYATSHSRLFYVVARLHGQTEAAQADIAVTWLHNHYPLIDSIKKGVFMIYLYNTKL